MKNNSYHIAKISLLLALIFFIATNLFYALNKGEFFMSGASPVYSFVSLSLLVIGSTFVGMAAFSYLSAERQALPATALDATSKTVEWRLGKIISDAVFNEKWVWLVSGAFYAVFFAFLDGILIYQPTVDFSSVYGVTSSKAIFTTCCGPPGYVPVENIYFPAQHFGIQLIPISIFIMIAVSALVGLNVSLLYTALKQTTATTIRSRIATSRAGNKKGFAGGVLGAAFGLFAGCPTCAAAFFMSMIAGSGATFFLFLIAEEPVILALTVPLLLFSIVWQAKSIRAFLRGCSTV